MQNLIRRNLKEALNRHTYAQPELAKDAILKLWDIKQLARSPHEQECVNQDEEGT